MNIAKVTKKVSGLIKTIDHKRPQLAFQLLHLKEGVNWKHTEYQRWSKYCKECVHLSHSAIFVYVNAAKKAELHNFNQGDVETITDAIGWKRFCIGINKLDVKEEVTVLQFIALFKNVDFNERTYTKSEEGELVNFSFNLPPETATILNNILLANGMRVCKKGRSNVSGAMQQVVENHLKDPF